MNEIVRKLTFIIEICGYISFLFSSSKYLVSIIVESVIAIDLKLETSEIEM